MKSGPYHGLEDLGYGPINSLTSSPALWPHSLCSSLLALSQLGAFYPCYSLCLEHPPCSWLHAPPSHFLPGLFSCSCYSLPTWLYFLHFISIVYHDSLYFASLFSVCLLHQNVRPRRVGVLFCLMHAMNWVSMSPPYSCPQIHMLNPNPHCDDIWRWNFCNWFTWGLRVGSP